jgi:hypothetical protein
MRIIDVTKRVFGEDGHPIPFESDELEDLLGYDPIDNIRGLVIPGKDENHQTLIVTDYNDYSLKVYRRQRPDKDSAWEKWEFRGSITT